MLNNEMKTWSLKQLIILTITVIGIAITFYFNTQNKLAAQDEKVEALKTEISRKANVETVQGVEKRLDRIENKIDNLIELQIRQQ